MMDLNTSSNGVFFTCSVICWACTVAFAGEKNATATQINKKLTCNALQRRPFTFCNTMLNHSFNLAVENEFNFINFVILKVNTDYVRNNIRKLFTLDSLTHMRDFIISQEYLVYFQYI